jgi:hypothetical protein
MERSRTRLVSSWPRRTSAGTFSADSVTLPITPSAGMPWRSWKRLHARIEERVEDVAVAGIGRQVAGNLEPLTQLANRRILRTDLQALGQVDLRPAASRDNALIGDDRLLDISGTVAGLRIGWRVLTSGLRVPTASNRSSQFPRRGDCRISVERFLRAGFRKTCRHRSDGSNPLQERPPIAITNSAHDPPAMRIFEDRVGSHMVAHRPYRQPVKADNPVTVPRSSQQRPSR